MISWARRAERASPVDKALYSKPVAAQQKLLMPSSNHDGMCKNHVNDGLLIMDGRTFPTKVSRGGDETPMDNARFAPETVFTNATGSQCYFAGCFAASHRSTPLISRMDVHFNLFINLFINPFINRIM